MVKAFELAITKAAKLPEAAQEQLGRELLERIEGLEQLRAEIEIGIRELDSGLGEELDIEDVIRQAHEEHAKKASFGHRRARRTCGMYGAITNASHRPRLQISYCAKSTTLASGSRTKPSCGGRVMR
jgi:hypothetical protein